MSPVCPAAADSTAPAGFARSAHAPVCRATYRQVMSGMHAAAARALLGCRPGACRAEVRRAFGRAVKQARPDLGATDAVVLATLAEARAVLLEVAGEDRRRRRIEVGAPANVHGLRRSSWIGD